jgi:transposase
LTEAELKLLNKKDLVELLSLFQNRENILLQLIASTVGLSQRLMELTIATSARLSRALDLIFGGSLKLTAGKKKSRKKTDKKKPESGKILPSERYPHLPIVEVEVKSDHPPQCNCGNSMQDSGMRETTERLDVQPKRYYITREKCVTYTCKACHTGIATTPGMPHIIPGSCYGDSFVEDVVLSKLCDLVPINRYTAIAERQGVSGIPANSLHEFHRHLAIYLEPSYKRNLAEIKNFTGALLADETRHNMMEGSEKKNWFLWTFLSDKGVVFLIEDTRAGEVAYEFLKDCSCRALVTDAYRGYSKALRIVNDLRRKSELPAMQHGYCNAHARNNFMANAVKKTRTARAIVRIYSIIFARYRQFVVLGGKDFDEVRGYIERAFLLIKSIAEKEKANLSTKSELYLALDYFLTYYDGLTLFLSDREIPMHNNRSERALRNPVIGRKVWFGTHSIASAQNQAKIMSLVESCKTLEVNPREFVKDAVARVHTGQQALSPYEYRQLHSNNSS